MNSSNQNHGSRFARATGVARTGSPVDSRGLQPHARSRRRTPNFEIIRYLSITSFLVIAMAAVTTFSLVYLYRQMTVDELIEVGESGNIVLAQAFANSIWTRFAPYVTSVGVADRDSLQARPETAQIREAVIALMKGLPVIKVKIYNLDGLTVFSTDPSEIGVTKASNKGFFMAARAGTTVSDVTHRGSINAFDGVLQDRDVLESYLPVRRGDGPVEAVFELYSDVTELIRQNDRVQRTFIIGLTIAFVLTYGGLILIVWRGDRILKRQYDDILRGEEDIKAKNRALEREAIGRKRTQEALQKSEEKFRDLIEGSIQGIYICRDRKLIFANQAMARIFGYDTPEDIMSLESVEKLHAPHESSRLGVYKYDRKRDQDIPFRYVGEYVRKDGSIIWVESINNLVIWDDEPAIQSTVVDVTERIRAEEAMRAAKQEAEQANRARSKFFAAASHDLRQPLHAISLFLSVLSKRVTTPKTREIVGAIQDSSDTMAELLNALLDISKLDAGVIRPEVGTVVTRGLFQGLVTEFAPQAREKGLDLRVVPVDLTITTDPALLNRILRNLLSNAIRHTPRGRVLFGARRCGSSLRFEIWDTGVGIRKDQIEEIFQEFYQVGNPERDHTQGLGLGLAVVTRLSALLGHSIDVTSTPGSGSMFSVTVPIAWARRSETTGARPAIDWQDGSLAGKAVVVIDDRAEVLKGMRMSLEDWGCRVLCAESADAALKEIAKFDGPPDAILADYRLRGEETGTLAVERIRRFVGANVPAVIITGDTDPRLIRETAESGYVLVHKPVPPEKLYRILQANMKDTRGKTEVGAVQRAAEQVTIDGI